MNLADWEPQTGSSIDPTNGRLCLGVSGENLLQELRIHSDSSINHRNFENDGFIFLRIARFLRWSIALTTSFPASSILKSTTSKATHQTSS